MNGDARRGDHPPLSPLGTARQRLAPAVAYPPELAAALRDADVDGERADEALLVAWQVVQWVEDPTARPPLLALFARTLSAVAQGSTRLRAPETRALAEAAAAVVGRPGERRPFIFDGEHLYPERLLAAEERLVAALARRLAADPLFPPEQVAAASEAAAGLGDEQRAAVGAALGRRLAVITGGPGTGKTTIVVRVVQALLRLGLRPEDIALAAPTGKAAHRLEEALASTPGLTSTAVTLHRLLGFAPRAGAFLRGRHHRLAHRAVIVDEGSMIDLVLMERLLAAVRDDAVLVLLGDADQLPSVEAGAVFRDLTPLALRLSRSFRQDPARGEGRRLLELGRAVRAGEAAAVEAQLVGRPDAAALTFSGAELVPAAAREPLLERWYGERITALPSFRELALGVHALDGDQLADGAALDRLHRHFQSFRLLCLTRGRPTGVEACNAWLHRRHAGGVPGPVPGEPLIMLRNDYERGLFNGDQGMVVSVRQGARPPRPMAVFPVAGGWRAFELDSLRDTVELSYAMTVHKAQGSEYDEVALLLPDVPIPLLSRELLYTALSRSRRAAVVCGSAPVLAAGVARPLVRSTGVGDKLRAALAHIGYSPPFGPP
jgi:exodeoxyribonuclease V alpha subunit